MRLFLLEPCYTISLVYAPLSVGAVLHYLVGLCASICWSRATLSRWSMRPYLLEPPTLPALASNEVDDDGVD